MPMQYNTIMKCKYIIIPELFATFPPVWTYSMWDFAFEQF